MPTTATTVKLTKLAAAGILKSVLPWVRKHPWMAFGGLAMAAPALTNIVNKAQGYNPEQDFGTLPDVSLLKAMTPRTVRAGQEAYGDFLDPNRETGMVDTSQMLRQRR